MKQESSPNLFDKIANKFFPNLMLHKKIEYLPLQINWRRIFILPTKPGIFYAFVTLLMLIASLNFNNNLGLMMTFLLFGIAQVAMYKVFFNLKDLTIDHITTKPVFAGETAIFSLQLKSSEVKFDICVHQENYKSILAELPIDSLEALEYKEHTDERGWLKIERLKISTSYPFGLFYAWIWTNLDASCLVYPKIEKSPPPLPTHAQGDGETFEIKPGEEFHGLKPFQSGDSMRLIAWKRTAQKDELISKEFQQIHGQKLLLDYSQIYLSDVEKKLSRLTAWCLIAYQQHIDYCLRLPDFDSGFSCTPNHHLACLKALALFGKQ
jgi:uncharacterized protein (DUF58 family)